MLEYKYKSYPLLERIYYDLVGSFDVYGNAGHQLSTRLYMDALRMEGESYFLDFLPQKIRQEMMASWNLKVKPSRLNYSPAPMSAGITFKTDEPKRELIEQVVNHHIVAKNIDFGVNYLGAGEDFPQFPKKYETTEDIIDGFIAASAPGVSFFRHVTDYNANVSWIRIKSIPEREDVVISMVVDRWHDNVRFAFREKSFLDPSKDRADFIPGLIGSYPNDFFVVDAVDLPDFLDILDNYNGSDHFINRLNKYGVNRADDDFWEEYDWFQGKFNELHKDRGGLVDLNRYFYRAMN